MKRFVFALLGLIALAPVAALAQVAGSPATERVYTLRLGEGTKTATATAGAATLNQPSGKITSEALTTAAAATYTLTITDNQIAAADMAFVSVANGTNSAGSAQVQSVTPGAGSLVIVIRNAHASAAFNGTLVVSFMSLKP